MTTASNVGVLVNTCFQVVCDKCGKITWKGCGQHIDSVGIISPYLQQRPSGHAATLRPLRRNPPFSSFRFAKRVVSSSRWFDARMHPLF
ncbi:hypothetical protein EDD15DRAFT_1373768 [Pisolithus albus]|nr:hypothetical protein EDD15DRAFT_1373768 [Pisolithus albus]